MNTISITIQGGVTIVSPVRRVSDHLGFTITGDALVKTIPALVATAKEHGSAVLAVESAKYNHTWVMPGNGPTYGSDNYVEGSHAQDDVVEAMVSDGLGKGRGTVSRNFRIKVDAVAADAFGLAAQWAERVTVWVSGQDLTVTATV